MSQTLFYSLAGVILFSLGLRGFLLYGHLIRKILAFNIMGSGIFLLLVGIAARNPEAPPDPVPHALVLTGLVVAVSFTAFALVLIRRIYAETGKTRLPSGEMD
jgi:multicomponent Na+:H+ antiporter subunit C